MMAALALLVLLAAPAGAADDYPIEPVRVVLRAEPGRLAADVSAESIYWIEEVLGEVPPPSGWNAEMLKKAEDYANAHLRLSAGGPPVRGKIAFARWSQELGQVHEQGTISLRLLYPELPADATLTGQADFYEEYRQERAKDPRPLTVRQEYATELEVPGRPAFRARLVPGANSFSLPAAQARRPGSALLVESLARGARGAFGAASAWPALLALVLALGAGPSRARALAWAAAFALGSALPGAAPAWLPWAAGAFAALAAGRWLPLPGLVLELPALAAAAWWWAAQAAPWLPGAAPTGAERAAAAVGAGLFGAAALFVGCLALRAERREMSRLSEAYADLLFDRRRALKATVLGLVCLCGLWRAVG